MDFRFEEHKPDLYKSVRDASLGRTLQAKHIRQFDDQFLAFAGAGAGMSVLEIGCGTGLFLQYLKHRGFGRVVGIDYDENLRDVLAGLSGDGIETAIGDAEAYVDRLPAGRSFDRIVLFDILEHLEIDAAVRLLRKLAGVLTADGRLVIRVPNASSPWGVRMHFDSFDHVTPYAPGRLRELASISGYRITALAGQATGKRRKRFFERCLHAVLSRLVTYHPEIWEAALIATFERGR